jgi:hypothetical protein
MPHSMRVGTELARPQHRSARRGEQARKASRHAHGFEKNVWPLFLSGVTPTRQLHGATPCVGDKSVKELQPLASFSRTPLSLLKVLISAKSDTIQTGKPAAVSRCLGTTWIRLASKKCAPNFPFSKERRDNRRRLCLDRANNLFSFIRIFCTYTKAKG